MSVKEATSITYMNNVLPRYLQVLVVALAVRNRNDSYLVMKLEYDFVLYSSVKWHETCLLLSINNEFKKKKKKKRAKFYLIIT